VSLTFIIHYNIYNLLDIKYPIDLWGNHFAIIRHALVTLKRAYGSYSWNIVQALWYVGRTLVNNNLNTATETGEDRFWLWGRSMSKHSGSWVTSRADINLLRTESCARLFLESSTYSSIFPLPSLLYSTFFPSPHYAGFWQMSATRLLGSQILKHVMIISIMHVITEAACVVVTWTPICSVKTELNSTMLLISLRTSRK
jgi:hypothetical protein